MLQHGYLTKPYKMMTFVDIPSHFSANMSQRKDGENLIKPSIQGHFKRCKTAFIM
jgi:hypothetical protein